MSIRVGVSFGAPMLTALALVAGVSSHAQRAPIQPAAAVSSANGSTTSSFPHGDPQHGKDLYQSCTSCHSIDENDIGPKHRGVVGRVAGSVPDYAYSPALKASGIVWSPETLDRWLTNPSAM